MQFAENIYTLRYASDLVQKAVLAQGGPDAETLALIESTLNTAATQYQQRQYQDAIKSYEYAGTLIYQFLDPQIPFNIGSIYEQVSKDPKLFDPLLTISAQYMNILPPVTVQGLRPSAPVDPAVLGGGTFDRVGIRTPQLGTIAAMGTTTLERTGVTTGVVDRLTPGTITRPAPPGAPAPAPPAAAPRSLGILVGQNVVSINWAANATPAIEQIKSGVYGGRVALKAMPDVLLNPQQPSDVAIALPHYYYYVIPLGIAECQHALGDYANAETHYFQAASYQYINTEVEVPYVWIEIAKLYLDWGNSLFRDGDAPDATPIYERVIGIDDSVPTSTLYTTANLASAAASAKTVVANTVAKTAIPNSINPQLSATILEIRAQLIKIKAGLDFFGLTANTVPIWTFDYLQSVAINFANLAINAERDFISFQSRSDDGTVTRDQLQQTVVQAQGEAQAAQMQADATQAELTAYQDGVALATLRAQDANAAVNDYATQSWYQNAYSAEAAQVQGGDDGDPGLLQYYVDQLKSGHDISDSRGTVGGALQLAASSYARQYEIDQLQRTASEMQAATKQAQDEATAAQARVNAANQEAAVANLRVIGAQQVLFAFDSQYFTPDVWQAMGQAMYALYQRYFTMALRVAKLMQLAYNFETDQQLAIIRTNYASDEVKGLLGADSLMADIQSFTYDLVTSHAGKPQPIRHEISLAANYPYLFETQFRKTGTIDFETRVDDFDSVYPGTYAGRIASVEVVVDGIVPVLGISGTLTNNGVSTYRLPSALWPNNGTPGVKYRIQSKETLVISDYALRTDDLLYRDDSRMLRIFEGAGVASSWHLEIPKSVNDVDYGAITDVRLVFYYDARYDDTLKTRVLQHLATLPAVTQRSRSCPLAWLYPDAFFHFQDTGTLQFELRQSDFARNERQPTLTDIALLVTTQGKPASSITLELTVPAHAAVTGTTDASGIIASGGAAAFTPLAAGTALGTYTITMPQASNAAFVTGGKLDLSAIVNMSLIFGYSFTPRA